MKADWQRYRQTQSLTYLGGVITECQDVSTELATPQSACWMCIRRYQQELWDRPNVPLDFNIRMVKAEEVWALFYGCVTWTRRQEHYRKLHTVHHRILLRIIRADDVDRTTESRRITMRSSWPNARVTRQHYGRGCCFRRGI